MNGIENIELHKRLVNLESRMAKVENLVKKLVEALIEKNTEIEDISREMK